MWNVKTGDAGTWFASAKDLIDTLWNVKVAVEPDAVVAPFDLIDTLWNVKLSALLIVLRSS